MIKIILIAYLIILSIIDIKKREIENYLTYSLIIAGLIYSILTKQTYLYAVILFFFGYFLFHVSNLGGADVKVLTGIGFFITNITQFIIFLSTLAIFNFLILAIYRKEIPYLPILTLITIISEGILYCIINNIFI